MEGHGRREDDEHDQVYRGVELQPVPDEETLASREDQACCAADWGQGKLKQFLS